MKWHLYLLACADGSLYAGITTDVERRWREHISGKGARYTRSHKPVRLLISRPFGSRSEALKAELAIKRLPKDRKFAALQAAEPPGATPARSNPLDTRQRNRHVNKAELVEIVAKNADIAVPRFGAGSTLMTAISGRKAAKKK